MRDHAGLAGAGVGLYHLWVAAHPARALGIQEAFAALLVEVMLRAPEEPGLARELAKRAIALTGETPTPEDDLAAIGLLCGLPSPPLTGEDVRECRGMIEKLAGRGAGARSLAEARAVVERATRATGLAMAAPAAGSPARAGSPAAAEGGNAAVLAALQDRLQKDAGSGRVSPGRAQELNALLGDLGALLESERPDASL